MSERVEHSVVIDRPVEEVFAYVTDANNDPLWQSSILESEQTSEGVVGVGTTYRIVTKFLGRRIEMTLEITEHDPGRKECFRYTSGPIPGGGCYLFERADDGSTRFTQDFEAEVGGVFRLAKPLVARVFKRQIQTDMATLKDLLEAGAAEGV
jgi:uncharacterized membrane protein